MQKQGWHVFPIDYHGNRFKSKAQVFELDLSLNNSITLLEDMISTMRPKGAHFGLMCGTCSRARDRPVASALRSKGAPNPVPLRDGDNLMGFANRSPSNQYRVTQANAVYINAVRLLFALFQVNAVVTLENPTRSWLWAILAKLVKDYSAKHNRPDFCSWYFAFVSVVFDMCMHGGTKDKSTKLLVSDAAFLNLAMLCDKSHAHTAWTIHKGADQWHFATAAEAEYPGLLCSRYAAVASSLVPSEQLDYTSRAFRLDTLQAMSVQSSESKQLIPEFSSVEWCSTVPTSPHKVLARSTSGGTKSEDFKVGHYLSMEEHLQRAEQLSHPVFSANGVPDDLKRAIHFIATHSIAEVASFRLQRLKECIELAKRLSLAEKLARIKMDKNISTVTRDKRLELWQQLLEQIGFEDMSVVGYMRDGVALTGWEPESDLYKKRWSPPTMTEQSLDASAVWRRRALMGKPMGEDERELADQLMQETDKEVQLGFLTGPFSEDQVNDLMGRPDWTMSQRFLLLQGEELKPRVIDNYKTSAVNSAFGSSSHLDLHDTDVISCLLTFALEVFNGPDQLNIKLSTGEILRGKRHSDYNSKTHLLGRGVDLSKAYKQVGIAPSSMRHGVLGVRNKEGKWSFFLSQSLPFGATASVYAFNKITRGIWSILVRKFYLINAVFYDDFPIVEFQPLAELTSRVIQTVLDLLGWKHATTGKKSVDFSLGMQVLGVTFDLSYFWKGHVEVANRRARVERILKMLEGFQSRKAVLPSEAASMHGLLNYAGGFVVGRSLKPAARYFAALPNGTTDERMISRICQDTSKLLQSMKPRILRYLEDSRPALLYTDGAFEGGKGTWGAVVIIPSLGIRAVHWGVVPEAAARYWESIGLTQLICQIELFAALLVRYRYRTQLANIASLYFIDNEAARHCLIKGSSPSLSMYNITFAFSFIDTLHPSTAWFERVPSLSNIADMPSRDLQVQCSQLIGGTLEGDITIPVSIMNVITGQISTCQMDGGELAT